MTILHWCDAVAVVAAILLVYVAQQAGHDKSCIGDPVWLQWSRRGAFYLSALADLNAAANDMAPLSLLAAWTCMMSILAVNAIVLHLKKPPRQSAAAQPVVFDIAQRARRRSF